MQEDEKVKLQLQQQTARDAFAVIASSGQGSAARVSKFLYKLSVTFLFLFPCLYLSLDQDLNPAVFTGRMFETSACCRR